MEQFNDHNESENETVCEQAVASVETMSNDPLSESLNKFSDIQAITLTLENNLNSISNILNSDNYKNINVFKSDTEILKLHQQLIDTINRVEINIDVRNTDGLTLLQTIKNNSINLVLVDPPYVISHQTGMNAHYDAVQHNIENNIEFIKTEEEWTTYKLANNLLDDSKKENYKRYGTIYGKKYCVKTEYGSWDSDFTIDKLDKFICEYYKKLVNGGTLIVFFDIWKITILKEIMEKYKFKQIRFIEWIKTNPQPLNSRVNYLTNCREIALLGIKGSNPIFNSHYDDGIYRLPLQGGKLRFHPTQKSLPLFEQIIMKHSNEGDIVLDTFLGGGTSAYASKRTNRRFIGCEISKEYYDKIIVNLPLI